MSRLMLCGVSSWLNRRSAVLVRADEAAVFFEKLVGKVTRDQMRPGDPVIIAKLRDPR